MKIKIGLGFIGCGKHALRGHAEVVVGMPKMFSVLAAFDPDNDALESFTELFPDIERVSLAEDVLNNPDVNAIVIATPHQFHLDLMEQAVNASKHVLCEKPLWMGDNTKRAKAILKKAARKGLVVTSCHPRRFGPEYRSLKDNLKGFQARYGEVVEVHYRFFYHRPSSEWRKADSLLLDHMNHEIDVVNFLLGSNPVELRRLTDSYDRYEVVGSRNDGVGIHFSGYRRLEKRIYINELELTFARGRVRMQSFLEDGQIRAVETRENFDANTVTTHKHKKYSYESVFADIMRNFADAIQDRAVNYLTPEDLIINTESCNTLIETGEYTG